MKKVLVIALTALVFVFGYQSVLAVGIAERLSGQILLQVESHGEAWYLNPTTKQRHYMATGADAFSLMRGQGVGISTANLSKIPIGLLARVSDDNDKDGISNLMEDAIGTKKDNRDSDGDSFDDGTEVRGGYNPLGTGKVKVDMAFANKQKGKIFLQVEGSGEAWYINPKDAKRYFLGRPADAYEAMRALGLGITNSDLAQIVVSGKSPASTSSQGSSGYVFRGTDAYDFGTADTAVSDAGNQPVDSDICADTDAGVEYLRKNGYQDRDLSTLTLCSDQFNADCSFLGGETSYDYIAVADSYIQECNLRVADAGNACAMDSECTYYCDFEASIINSSCQMTKKSGSTTYYSCENASKPGYCSSVRKLEDLFYSYKIQGGALLETELN